MLHPIKVIELELSQPLTPLSQLDGYRRIQALVRWHRIPIGYVRLPVVNGGCSVTEMIQAVVEQQGSRILQAILQCGLPSLPDLHQKTLIEKWQTWMDPPPVVMAHEPLVSVAVCSRDRPQQLRACLASLKHLTYPHLDIIVVDNAPSDDSTRILVQTDYPDFKYIQEIRPGLNWARNRAIIEAQGEILAFTDDDVVVDPDWIQPLVTLFMDHPQVMAVTGLVAPLELETEAQVLFEAQGGFGRGFQRQWYHSSDQSLPWAMLGTGNYGTGANMAYRRLIFHTVGLFNPALDVGTPTQGAGDLEMFYRILKHRYTLVYEPSAIVYHRHRFHYSALRHQLQANGSVFAYIAAANQAHPEDKLGFLQLSLNWILSWHSRRLILTFIYPARYPRDLIWAELQGCWKGLNTYTSAQSQAIQIEAEHGSLTLPPMDPTTLISMPKCAYPDAVAVHSLELTQPWQPLAIEGYTRADILVTWQGSPLGRITVTSPLQVVSITQLQQAVREQIGLKILDPSGHLTPMYLQPYLTTLLHHHLSRSSLAQLSPMVSSGSSSDYPSTTISIVIGTFDRPHDLRQCLLSILAQKTCHSFTIIVVDNHPHSQHTPLVIAELTDKDPSYPIQLISESRQGVSYARNTGILASTGDIIVTLDDDVTVPEGWLEALLDPFQRADVMAVTGNVLPLELNTPAQRVFEYYGGLGRGFERRVVDGDWFEKSWRHAVPTWELGGTANAAFRASVFQDPAIGLMDEALGPGMPSGVGEDIYLFYRILKADHTIVYEPNAYVWHRHRRDPEALNRQLYNYSKGFIAYHLTTLLNDGDWRALPTVLFHLPIHHLKRLYSYFRGYTHYPVSLILQEVLGHLMGPWSLWRSWLRVEQQGTSRANTK